MAKVEARASVPVMNSSQAFFATVDDEDGWIGKSASETGPGAMLAEALGYLLGDQLKVPMPEAAVYGIGPTATWLSRMIPFAAHWNPAHALRVANLEDLGRMLALDAIIFNGDRHQENILLSTDGDPLTLRAWAIDHGHASIGWPSDLDEIEGELPPATRIARGLPLELMESGARAAAAEAAAIGSHDLREFVTEAAMFAGYRDAAGLDRLRQTLRTRCDLAPDLVSRYLELVGEVR